MNLSGVVTTSGRAKVVGVVNLVETGAMPLAGFLSLRRFLLGEPVLDIAAGRNIVTTNIIRTRKV